LRINVEPTAHGSMQFNSIHNLGQYQAYSKPVRAAQKSRKYGERLTVKERQNVFFKSLQSAFESRCTIDSRR